MRLTRTYMSPYSAVKKKTVDIHTLLIYNV